MRQLKFPPYEYIKHLSRHKEYSWTIFSTPVSTEGMLSYNEDCDGFISFDVLENGYVDMNNLGLTLKFNKGNYTKLCKHAQQVFEEFHRELDIDWSDQWERYGDDQDDW